jgi:hypothetical protein
MLESGAEIFLHQAPGKQFLSSSQKLYMLFSYNCPTFAALKLRSDQNKQIPMGPAMSTEQLLTFTETNLPLPGLNISGQ